jgi:phospho-N-acetylmuramoyl-pentapeptide-transferase
MLYHLIQWLESNGTHIPGSGAFVGITTRVLLAVLLSLVITTVYGKRLIRFLQRKQIGESVRELGLAGEAQKKGTPTMGGIIIILAILIPTLLLANLTKVYVRLMIFSPCGSGSSDLSTTT